MNRGSGTLPMLRAVALLLALSGCSFAFTANPPPPCSSSAVAPIADTAAAVVAGLAAVYIATGDDDNVTAALVGVTAIGAGASAVVGYRRVGRCRDARAGAR
jgi:LPXTG-motif cell wall-anchored protein